MQTEKIRRHVGETNEEERAAKRRRKRKKQAQRTAFEVPRLLQTTKASKQQENEQQRNPLLLNPRDPVSPTATCIYRHETHPRSLDTLARACPSSRPWWLGSMDGTLRPGLLYAYWAAPETLKGKKLWKKPQRGGGEKFGDTTVL
jgi:hypothetical protein